MDTIRSTTGVNQLGQKAHNLSLILRFLIRSGGSSRVRLAEYTGLTQAAIGKMIGELSEAGLVFESADPDLSVSGKGRKPVLLQINGTPFRAVCLRMNREHLSGAVCDLTGRVYLTKERIVPPLTDARTSMNCLLEICEELIHESDILPMCLGIAVPGPFNYRTSRICMETSFPGWSQIDLKQELESRFHLPAFADQDANCGALAETWTGNWNVDEDLLYVIADIGIGAGLIHHGRIFRGALGYAGEIGHISINMYGPRCECGNRGCLELYSSSQSLRDQYLQAKYGPLQPDPHTELSADEILALVRSGDPLACEVYRNSISCLAFGTVSLINALNPDTIVFSDRLTRGGPLFLDTINRTLKQYLIEELYERTRILVSACPGDPILLGSGLLAFDHLLRDPLYYFHSEQSGR